MVGKESIESGLDVVAETVGEQATEGFEVLGNETRLAILLTLWEAQEPGGPTSEAEDAGLSFSGLREHLGRPDSGQFNYHLGKLVGPFVKQSEDGTVCANCGQRWDPQWTFVCEVCKLDWHKP